MLLVLPNISKLHLKKFTPPKTSGHFGTRYYLTQTAKCRKIAVDYAMRGLIQITRVCRQTITHTALTAAAAAPAAVRFSCHDLASSDKRVDSPDILRSPYIFILRKKAINRLLIVYFQPFLAKLGQGQYPKHTLENTLAGIDMQHPEIN